MIAHSHAGLKSVSVLLTPCLQLPALSTQLMAEPGLWGGEPGGYRRLLERCVRQLLRDRLVVQVGLAQAGLGLGGVVFCFWHTATRL